MRATIELPDRLRASVMAVAARKGYRGYSKVIVEAIEFYLAEKAAREGGLAELRALRGAWTGEEAEAVRQRIAAVRENWRPPAS